MKKPGLSTLLIFLLVTGVIGSLIYYFQGKHKGCTMEAKLCPDGTAVGRTGPNCAFTPCPSKPGTSE